MKVPLLGQVLEICLFTFCCENQFTQFYFSFIFYREQCILLGQALDRCISKVTVDMALVCVKMNSATRNTISRKNPKIRFQPSWLSEICVHHSSVFVDTKQENGKNMNDKYPKDEEGTAWPHFGSFLSGLHV